jgi:peroxiredoxin family protein
MTTAEMTSVLDKIKGQSSNGKKSANKLAIVASKGSLDMVYPVLILANGARMSGIDVDIFCTFWGVDMITKKKMGKVNIATVGNPAFSMAPYAPWFKIPTWMGLIPGMSKIATWMMQREIAKLDFPPIPEFIQTIVDSGAKVYGCQMTMDMMGLTVDDLVDGAEVLGVMEMLELTKDSNLIFI